MVIQNRDISMLDSQFGSDNGEPELYDTSPEKSLNKVQIISKMNSMAETKDVRFRSTLDNYKDGAFQSQKTHQRTVAIHRN